MVVLTAWNSGCGTSEVTTTLGAEERFQRGKALFDNEDYLDAINEFKIVTLQHQGSAWADDAQFYLAESHYARGEYQLAALEYGLLRRNMPASPFVPLAQFQLAMSYYQLAPKPNLDQDFTVKAIDAFQAFVDYHPSHEKAVEAEEKIRELVRRLAQKQFDTARLYATMGYYKAAIVYYDDVIERYHDTEFAPRSYLGKAAVLIERKRYEDARREILKYKERFPEASMREADELLQRIKTGMNTRSASASEKTARPREDSVSSRVRP